MHGLGGYMNPTIVRHTTHNGLPKPSVPEQDPKFGGGSYFIGGTYQKLG